MQARPLRPAQASSASALVPRMSDLKPPSQNRPGAPPGALAHRNPAGGRAGSHVQEFQARIVHGVTSRLAVGSRAAVFRRKQPPNARGGRGHSDGDQRRRCGESTGAAARAGRRDRPADHPRVARQTEARTAVNIAHALVHAGARAHRRRRRRPAGQRPEDRSAANGCRSPARPINPFRLRRNADRLEPV